MSASSPQVPQVGEPWHQTVTIAACCSSAVEAAAAFVLVAAILVWCMISACHFIEKTCVGVDLIIFPWKCHKACTGAGAMRLVAEAFPWSEHSTFAYTLDNHNSTVGMRGYALEQQAFARAVHMLPQSAAGEPAQFTSQQHASCLIYNRYAGLPAVIYACAVT